MGMVDARSLRGVFSFGYSIAQGSALCVSPSSKSGCVKFYLTTFHLKILERTICLVHLIASDWSRTSAELPHKIHCTFGSAGNLLTHPAIYGSSDPEGIPPFSEGKRNEFQKTDFEILRSVE
ncbi:hypothetical protein TNCV_3420241 [Trichonephila clavipes]|nr:hypothetical protein TNCV_3420241 [Trichonephila clavipes]